MKWSDFDTYLRPEHLNGKPVRVKIAKVTAEQFYFGGQTETCPVLHLEGTRKRLVLSNVNRRTLARLFGDDTSGCIGKTVLLAVETVKVAGKDKPTIRIIQGDGQA